MKIKLLDGVTAANNPPTAGSATVGFPLTGLGTTGMSHNVPSDGVCALVLESTAGSGTMTVTVKIWVYSDAIADWMPYGTDSTAANRGVMNEANAIDEVVSDKLRHTELVAGLDNYERIYAEVTAIGGTATAVDLWLVGR